MTRPDYYGNPAGLTADVEVVREIYAAFAARDLDRALASFAPDCELRLVGTARAVGRTEPYRGHVGVREYQADVARLWDELTVHADDFRSVPGSVIVMGRVEGCRDGQRFERAVMWTWRLRDGLVTSVLVSDMGEPQG